MARVGEYRKLRLRHFPPREDRETAEGRWWSSFKEPETIVHPAMVSNVAFSPVSPYYLAATASTKVVVYDCRTLNVKRNLTRFKDIAYSGNFRSDGKLLVAGGENKHVQLLDINSRSLLRLLRGHDKAVHVTQFSPDKLNVLSGSDDCTVRWWDIVEGKDMIKIQSHKDYVRSACASPASSNIWATGSYDSTAKIHDMRTGKVVLNLKHERAVEDVIVFPSGSLVAVASGPEIFIWDIVGGGRLLNRISNFQKTVLCLEYATAAGSSVAVNAQPRLLAGSLDCHVKMYDIENFQTTNTYTYGAPVTSLAMSPLGNQLAVGMSDGMLSLRQRSRAADELASATKRAGTLSRSGRRSLRATSSAYFIRGQNSGPKQGDYVVFKKKSATLQPYDKYLRKFRYSEALDSALQDGNAHVVLTVIEELRRRQGLKGGIGGRNSRALYPLLKFLQKHIGDPRYTSTLCEITNLVLDIYSEVAGTVSEIDEMFLKLYQSVQNEVEAQHKLLQLKGMVQVIIQEHHD